MNTTADDSDAGKNVAEKSQGLSAGFPVAGQIIEQIADSEPGSNPASASAEGSASEKPALKGFGYLYKRGRLWWIRYSVRSKDFRESSGSERERDAMKLLKKRWQEVGKGRFIGPSEDRVLIDDLFQTLQDDYAINGRRSARMLKYRLRHLRSSFGGMKAIDVTEDLIERYKVTRLAETTERGKKQVRPATVNRELAALRKAFSLAVRQKRIGAARIVTMLEENNARQGFVEVKDFEAIVSHLPEYLRDFSWFAYLTGWRKGELQTLAWADVNREATTILLRQEHSKNKESRLLPLVGELAEIIERRWQARVIEDDDGSTRLAEFVFHCSDGSAVGDFRHAWATACTKAGMPGLLFHDLRRSAVRNFDRSGVGQAVAMKITGHKTLSVYQRYRIVNEKDMQEALQRTQAALAESKGRRVVPIAEAKKASR